MSTLTLAVLSFMLLLVATVQGVPLNDHTILKKLSLNNRLQHLNRINQLGDAKEKKAKASFEPYIIFKNKPPVELCLQPNSKNYFLECEVSGSPNPRVHWLKNKKLIPGSQVTYMEMQENNKLSLSMVRSRTFLDCLPEGKVVYTCVGQVNANSVEDILVDTAIDVKPIPHAIFRAGEGEMYGNPNAIDFADKEIDFLIQPNLNGCFASKQMGSPARIHYFTKTVLENIGQDVVILCRALGHPKPKITWTANEVDVISDTQKYQVLDSGDLVVRNVTFDDMGAYKCTATNKYATDEVNKIFLYPTTQNKAEGEK